MTKISFAKCIVKGCGNHSDGGTFVGVLCSPCHQMITTGEVHSKNPTFIGDLHREVSEWKQAASVEAGLRRDFNAKLNDLEGRLDRANTKLLDLAQQVRR
jgi:hypothetical protein